MITKRDALEWWLEKVPLDCQCGAVANKSVVVASPWMSKDEAAALLMRNRVHHVVVTDGEGVFTGILSSWDLARELGRNWELPYWEEFYERVRNPRQRISQTESAPAA